MSDFIASSTSEDRYLTNRLTYSRDRESGEEQFGPITFRAFFKAWFIWSLVAYAYLFVGFVLVTFLMILGGGDEESMTGAAIFVSVLSVIAAGFVPQRRWVSAWDFLIDGRAGASESSYSMIAKSLLERRTPADVKPVRLINPHARGSANHLRVEIPQYEVWLSVFPYGEDLFVGWTMVRRNRLGGIFFRYLWERLLVLFGKSTDFHFQIAANDARALRDAVHNSARQGVELAIAGTNGPSISEAFGFEVPVQQNIARGQGGAPTQGTARPPAIPPSGSSQTGGGSRPFGPPPVSPPPSTGIGH
jgi:hypothetical protein